MTRALCSSIDMAAPRRRLLLSLFCLCVATQSLAAVDHIKETCSPTPFPDLCVASLQRVPGSHGADARRLAELAIGVATEMAGNTSSYLSNLLGTHVKDHKWQQCLYDCTEDYLEAIEQLDDCAAAVDRSHYDNANSWLAAAMASVDNCDGGCQEAGASDYAQLSKLNGEFSNMCSVILAIVELIRK